MWLSKFEFSWCKCLYHSRSLIPSAEINPRSKAKLFAFTSRAWVRLARFFQWLNAFQDRRAFLRVLVSNGHSRRLLFMRVRTWAFSTKELLDATVKTFEVLGHDYLLEVLFNLTLFFIQSNANVDLKDLNWSSSKFSEATASTPCRYLVKLQGHLSRGSRYWAWASHSSLVTVMVCKIHYLAVCLVHQWWPYAGVPIMIDIQNFVLFFSLRLIIYLLTSRSWLCVILIRIFNYHR